MRLNPNADLFEVIRRGAVLRRHKVLADFLSLVPFALASGAIQCAIYLTMLMRVSYKDWTSAVLVCAMLMVMPFVVAGILAALRRNNFPFTATVFITLVIYNFGIVVLAAARIHLSYSALLITLPIAVGAMVLATALLRRGSNESVAMLDFPGAKAAVEQFEHEVAIISDPTTEITAYDRILFDGATHHGPAWTKFLNIAHMRGIEVAPWVTEIERRHRCVDLQTFDISHLAYGPAQIYYTKAKRFLDVLLLIVVLPIVLPLGALVWLYIRVIDGGPSLFVQTRRGYGGRNFRMYKFRTMRNGTQGGAAGLKDKRILPGCRILRRFRIDELPQLINIWRGEMSWIGPRPVSIEIARKCEKRSPHYVNRYLLLPGISGWAQVKYGYAGTLEEEMRKLSYDLYYLKKISFDLDLEIILRTLKTLLTRNGAR